MSTYPNGKIPDHLLIRRGDFLLTAGTWAKFDDLVARVKKRTGITLRISTGSTSETRGAGAFRTYPMQVLVKAYWTRRGQSRMAAAPGTSSHGGEYKGADALAIDITNYSQIPLNVFFEEGRAAGFQMGYFDGKNGKPYEPWHIIDRDPYRIAGSTAGGNAKPINTITPTPESEEEDEDMRFKFGHRTDGTTDEWMIVHPSIKGGYQVTTNQKRAIAWARLYGRGWLADENARYDFNVPRDEYIELQNAARAVASGWVG